MARGLEQVGQVLGLELGVQAIPAVSTALPGDCPLLPDWDGTLKSQMLSRGEQEWENGSPFPTFISIWGREPQFLPLSLAVRFQARASWAALLSSCTQ